MCHVFGSIRQTLVVYKFIVCSQRSLREYSLLSCYICNLLFGSKFEVIPIKNDSYAFICLGMNIKIKFIIVNIQLSRIN